MQVDIARCANSQCAAKFVPPREYVPLSGFCESCRKIIKERCQRKMNCACFPYVCSACECTLTGSSAALCTECGGEFHQRCFELHECLDAQNGRVLANES